MRHIRTLTVIGLITAAVFGLSTHWASATVPNISQLLDVSTTGGVANQTSGYPPVFSQDGRYVVWASGATNLVSTPATTGNGQVYVRDIKNGTTTLISKNSSGTPANYQVADPSISANGRYIVYTSSANNLTPEYNLGNYHHVYLHDTKTGTTQLVDKDSSGNFNYHRRWASFPKVSDDGKYVMFRYRSQDAANIISTPTLSANVEYIMMKNMATGEVKLVNEGLSSAAPNASQNTQPYMSCDGVYVAFSSTATNLVSTVPVSSNNAYIRDMRAETTTIIKPTADNNMSVTDLSCNGQNIGIASQATNLTSTTISGTHWQGYLYNRINDDFSLVSQSTSGTLGNNSTNNVKVSNSGDYAAFSGSASNLISGTTYAGVIFRNISANTNELLCASSAGVPCNANSNNHAMSADGKYVGFFSTANNILPGVYYQYANGTYGHLTYITRTGASYDY